MFSIKGRSTTREPSPSPSPEKGEGIDVLIDTHAHLADTKFDADRDAAIARAREAGVATLIEIAESPDTWDAAIQLAETHAFIYASLGIHPHHAHEAGPDRWPELSQK